MAPAIAVVSSGSPWEREYWFLPDRIASKAASIIQSGPLKSGKPWARLIAPRSVARRVISLKMEVPKGLSLELITLSFPCPQRFRALCHSLTMLSSVMTVAAATRRSTLSLLSVPW